MCVLFHADGTCVQFDEVMSVFAYGADEIIAGRTVLPLTRRLRRGVPAAKRRTLKERTLGMNYYAAQTTYRNRCRALKYRYCIAYATEHWTDGTALVLLSSLPVAIAVH
jgi:hypothetical protein